LADEARTTSISRSGSARNRRHEVVRTLSVVHGEGARGNTHRVAVAIPAGRFKEKRGRSSREESDPAFGYLQVGDFDHLAPEHQSPHNPLSAHDRYQGMRAVVSGHDKTIGAELARRNVRAIIGCDVRFLKRGAVHIE